MKTEYEIYMNFKKAEIQADRLRSIAENMNSLANQDIENTLRKIQKNWIGENADAYLSKAEIVKNKIENTAEDILVLADSIISIAERTMATELAAIGIAKG